MEILLSPRSLVAGLVSVATLAACGEANTGAGSIVPARVLSPATQRDAPQVLWTFTGGSDGADPLGGVISDAAGNLYGGASAGAFEDRGGTVVKLTPSGPAGYAEQTLVTFEGSNGLSPSGVLAMDAAGQLFGTTVWGGRYGYGTAFRVTTKGRIHERVLWSFGGSSSDGAVPDAGLAIGARGALYGVTEYGGRLGYGTIFKLDPVGREYRESIIWSFGEGFDGRYPDDRLTLGPRGVIYGTASGGGNARGAHCPRGCGILFTLTPTKSGYSEKVLRNFRGAPNDGSGPSGSLGFDSRGDIYGTTYFGGDTTCASGYGCGAVYELARSAAAYTESVLWNFGKGSDGDYPFGNVLIGPRGTLYGTTQQGGTHLAGILYALAPSRHGYKEKILWDFNYGPYGYDPEGSVIMDSGHKIYGTAYAGGSTGDGTVFRFAP